MRSRRHVIEIQSSDPIDMLQNPRQLPSHPFNLTLIKPQPSQPRDMKNLFPLDHLADSRQRLRVTAGRG